MAERKTKTAKASNKNNKEIKETIVEAKTMISTLEEEAIKKVEEITEEAGKKIIEVKEMESQLLEKIEVEPENTPAILEGEIQKVEESIQEVENQIETLTETLKNNKVFATATSWNGWGYDI